MAHNLDPNELILTIVDQAHQIRRMNDMVVGAEAKIAMLEALVGQHKAELENAKVAREINEAAPKEAPRDAGKEHR